MQSQFVARYFCLDYPHTKELSQSMKLYLSNFQKPIARNRGHLAPVINCQRNLIFKMADKSYPSQGKRIPYDILNNLSSVDLFYQEKGKTKTS